MLDTNVCIGLLRNTAVHTARRIAEGRLSDFTLCSTVLFELMYGAARSSRSKAELEKILLFVEHIRCLEFDSDCAAAAGYVRAALEKKGQTIGPYDILIAGTALRYNLTLLTGNLREFNRVDGLRVENWEQ